MGKHANLSPNHGGFTAESKVSVASEFSNHADLAAKKARQMGTYPRVAIIAFPTTQNHPALDGLFNCARF